MLAENINVIVEIGQQNMLAKLIQRHFRIPLQPIVYDFLLRLHNLRNFVIINAASPCLLRSTAGVERYNLLTHARH